MSLTLSGLTALSPPGFQISDIQNADAAEILDCCQGIDEPLAGRLLRKAKKAQITFTVSQVAELAIFISDEELLNTIAAEASGPCTQIDLEELNNGGIRDDVITEIAQRDLTIRNQEQRIRELLAEQEPLIRQREELNKERSSQIVTNTGIHEMLVKILRSAKSEVDIMSPWVSRGVVKTVKEDMTAAVSRGVVIKVTFGIRNKKNPPQDDDRERKSRKVLNELQSEYGQKSFRFKFFSSHSKLIICDDDYYVLTSCNILSNVGDNWEEIGEVLHNQQNLATYLETYFHDF
jgi:prophage antirepressor-like protein